MLKFSIFLNLLLAGLIAYMIVRLGGVNYALFRIKNGEEALYFHRINQFEKLSPRPNAIVFLGDSQTEQGEWKELLGDTLPILNRGICGDHVVGILKRLDAILMQKPAKIFLCVGVNDLLFGKSATEIAAIYGQIMAKIRKETPFAQLFLESVLPVNSTIQRLGISNDHVAELNQKIEAIAKEYAIPFINIAPQLTNAQGNLSEKYTQDGVHLNGAGYLIWKQQVEPYLK
jgi:lysophospholipase L1-like esterase